MILLPALHNKNLKKTKLIGACLLLVSLSVQSQWDFEAETNGVPDLTSNLIFPITYNALICEFTFIAIYNSNLTDMTINNANHCANAHWLILDGYQYQMEPGFVFEFLADGYTSPQNIDMGSCSTFSGTPILDAIPSLQIGDQTFQFNPSFGHKVFIDNQQTFFQFQSANGEIFCTNGVEFVDSDDLIFSGRFE